MKFFPFYLFLILPITGFSQDSPAAIIVEDEETFETDSNSTITDEEIETSQNLEKSEADENFDTPNEEEKEGSGSATVVNETLPEQPEDLGLPDPEESVTVKVEIPKQIKLSKAETDDFKLITPWAPKPMQVAPNGWRYIPARQDKAYPVEVKLATGKILSLSVIPYTLVPELSKTVIQAREPGYQPERGYQQVLSISARLQTTADNLKHAGDSLDQSIENLSALVDSLPK